MTGMTTGIFKDREKLSPRYVPERLPHRERQVSAIYDFFTESLSYPSKSTLKTLQIIGPAGSGKTCSVLKFGERFEKETVKSRQDVRHVYVNLKLQGGSRVVLYRYLLEHATPEAYSTSLSAEEILRVLLRTLAYRKRYVVISLDEVDYFAKGSREAGVVYDLTRLNEIEPKDPCNVLGVIFTARSKEFHKLLDVAELSTLGRIAIEFPPYGRREIYDIISERAKEAFNPRSVSTEVLEYISSITEGPPANGDLRFALDLLLYSGILAENLGGDRVLPDHVRKVLSEIHPSITEEDIMNLPKKEHLVALLAVVKSLKGKSKTFVPMKEIRRNCDVICENMKIRPPDDLDSYLQDLEDRRIIEIQSLKGIGISGVPTTTLESFIDKLFRRLETGLATR